MVAVGHDAVTDQASYVVIGAHDPNEVVPFDYHVRVRHDHRHSAFLYAEDYAVPVTSDVAAL